MKPVLAEGRLSDRGEAALVEEAELLGLSPDEAKEIITEALQAANATREPAAAAKQDVVATGGAGAQSPLEDGAWKRL